MNTSIFKKLFPQSEPLNLLVEHAQLLEESIKHLKPMFEKYFAGESIEEHSAVICTNESRADDLKFNIREIISSGIKIPFDKSDFLDYLCMQETLIDQTKDIAKKLSLNRVTLEKKLIADIFELLDEVIKAVDYLENAIRTLKPLVYFSFSSKESEIEKEEVFKVEKIESLVDKKSIEIAKILYTKKHEIQPVDFYFIESVLIILSKMGDYAENGAELLLRFIKS
ncbi:DUF47 family protein [candidate division WOR-3 bacterium]|nr:DUF47 family protein [candidate division WOR-3 bacterium]